MTGPKSCGLLSPSLMCLDSSEEHAVTEQRCRAHEKMTDRHSDSQVGSVTRFTSYY